ncbi:hypothetical protein BSL78_22432 [Apostichopus japonicus]|uniref:Uncharacterized protein n=1 Tax=Stichopus japonicus TaxID=307972 RepID=A0A2G8JYC1_STIJA|nr:hypothetical protein BSL78_22432 [Apostichopus japonicus]
MEILVDASPTTPTKKGEITTAKKETAPKAPPNITTTASKIITTQKQTTTTEKQTTTTEKQTTTSASTTTATTTMAKTPTRTLTEKVSTIATPPAVETPTASSITESRATPAKTESKAPAKVTKSTKAPSARLTVPHGGGTTKGTVTQNSTNSGTGFLPGIDKDSFTAKVIIPIAAGIVLAVFIVFIACSVRSCLDKDGKGSSSRRRLMSGNTEHAAFYPTDGRQCVAVHDSNLHSLSICNQSITIWHQRTELCSLLTVLKTNFEMIYDPMKSILSSGI